MFASEQRGRVLPDLLKSNSHSTEEAVTPYQEGRVRTRIAPLGSSRLPRRTTPSTIAVSMLVTVNSQRGLNPLHLWWNLENQASEKEPSAVMAPISGNPRRRMKPSCFSLSLRTMSDRPRTSLPISLAACKWASRGYRCQGRSHTEHKQRTNEPCLGLGALWNGTHPA